MTEASDTRQEILLIRLKSIGDILFTLPAVHLVRTAFPEANIRFLVSKEYAPLLEGFQEVDSVICLDRGRFRQANPVGIVTEAVSLLRGLRRPRFSLAIDFQGYGETALLTWWSGAPKRWGTVYRSGSEWAYTQGVPRDTACHPAENFLSLLHKCGLAPAPVCNQFTLPESAVEEARRLFLGWGLEAAKQTLFLQPFTSSPHKDWGLDHYLALARLWQGRGWQIVFGGGPAERAALEPARQAGFPVSAGTPLLVTAGLMEFSTLVLGGNTGLPHLAVAMGKRVVMIMDWIDPGSAHPFQHRDWAVTPANGQSLADMPTGAVDDACGRALAELGQK